MKLLLKELINPNTALLTDTQKAVLIITHVATSPKMAYSDTNVSENLVKARQGLGKMNMVKLGDNMLVITDHGNSMLQYHNLVDETGELTGDGRGTLNSIKDTSGSFNNQSVRETFKFLSGLL